MESDPHVTVASKVRSVTDSGESPYRALGARVEVRPITPEDQDQLIRLARESVELHSPWINAPATASAFETTLARFDGQNAMGFVVCRAGTGVIAGFINLNEIVRGPYLRGVLGYGAFAPSAGQGYMREGLELVVQIAFGPLGLHRLEADIQASNERSLNLAKRLGFRREGFSPDFICINGVWTDHERWALTKTD
jgi:ribosomal-protein-alanine N-acetyltransferase